MTLQLNGRIELDDIGGVKKLDPARPVYLLVGASGKLVVKRDNTPQAADPRNMRTALRNMKAVDRTMATKQLARTEIDGIAQFAELKRVESMLLGEPMKPDIAQLADDVGGNGDGTSWVKTNFFEDLITLESAVKQAEAGDKSGIRAIAAALSATGGLEKLGQILAVDCFNGNNDRFDFSGAPVVNQGYRRLSNPGNVALCLQNNVLRPVGMDAYAGFAEFRSVATGGPPDREWSGYRLKDDQKPWRATFSDDAATDIETVLGPRNRKFFFASKNRLPTNAGTRIATGMDEGIQLLKSKLLAMYAPEKRPAGLIARIVALGWAKPAPPPR